MSGEYQYIDTPAALAELCSRLQGQAWIAVDTEFMRERTYYPELCLVQVATDDLVACIDPLALPSLEPLLAVFLDARTVKVLHAARQDLEIFFHMAGRVPAPVFDTQVAARFLGLPDQAGYGAVVQSMLGITLDKSHARTDWARRPLSAAALDYAADDVRHLRNLYHKILADLAARDRASWVEPELKALVDEKLYRPDPDNAWHRVRGVQRLKPKTLTLMKSLAAWRERTAMSENRPRQWILKDESMMDLARQLPSDLESLAAVRGVGDSLAKRHGTELLKMLKADGEASAEERHPRETPLKPEQEALVDALNALLRINAAKGDVSAASLANRAELEKLVRGERELPLLKDWRLEMAGRQLLEFLEGRHVLSAAGGALKVTPVK
ncbi:MAG TPA: ribonuclease D [Gammaproteobacteria bacterium]|nr:ribonuclease D [Gammaproteobacteria bacterium]